MATRKTPGSTTPRATTRRAPAKRTSTKAAKPEAGGETPATAEAKPAAAKKPSTRKPAAAKAPAAPAAATTEAPAKPAAKRASTSKSSTTAKPTAKRTTTARKPAAAKAAAPKPAAAKPAANTGVTAAVVNRIEAASPTTKAVGIAGIVAAIGGAVLGALRFFRAGPKEGTRPTDLMGDTHPDGSQRAIEDFRPDPTAPVPASERDALQPALAKPTLVAGQADDLRRP